MLTETNTPKLGRGGHHNAPRPAKPFAVSDRDLELYHAIVAFKRNHDGCSPHNRELMALAHMTSSSVVAFHLRRLERAGLIELGSGDGAKMRVGRILVRGGRWTPPAAVPALEKGESHA